jgi:hypothetical protein
MRLIEQFISGEGNRQQFPPNSAADDSGIRAIAGCMFWEAIVVSHQEPRSLLNLT